MGSQCCHRQAGRQAAAATTEASCHQNHVVITMQKCGNLPLASSLPATATQPIIMCLCQLVLLLPTGPFPPPAPPPPYTYTPLSGGHHRPGRGGRAHHRTRHEAPETPQPEISARR